MDSNSIEIIKKWYYDYFGVWDQNPYPDWDQDLLISRAKEKVITLTNSEKFIMKMVKDRGTMGPRPPTPGASIRR